MQFFKLLLIKNNKNINEVKIFLMTFAHLVIDFFYIIAEVVDFYRYNNQETSLGFVINFLLHRRLHRQRIQYRRRKLNRILQLVFLYQLIFCLYKNKFVKEFYLKCHFLTFPRDQ